MKCPLCKRFMKDVLPTLLFPTITTLYTACPKSGTAQEGLGCYRLFNTTSYPNLQSFNYFFCRTLISALTLLIPLLRVYLRSSSGAYNTWCICVFHNSCSNLFNSWSGEEKQYRKHTKIMAVSAMCVIQMIEQYP